MCYFVYFAVRVYKNIFALCPNSDAQVTEITIDLIHLRRRLYAVIIYRDMSSVMSYYHCVQSRVRRTVYFQPIKDARIRSRRDLLREMCTSHVTRRFLFYS